jgi:hypothetical protein
MSPVRLFYVYAQEDETLQHELEKHLSGMKRSNLINTWHDRKLQADTNWAQEVDTHLESADIIVLLISKYFMASGYTVGLEMKRALARYNLGEAHIIPVLLRPVEWKETPFGHIEVLPTGGVPVTEWQERDEAFLEVVKGIRKSVTAISLSSLARRVLSVNKQDPQVDNILPQKLTEPEKDKNTLLPSRQSTIEEVARLLEVRRQNNHRTVLILGARAGRLFRSEDFFKTLQMFSKRNFSNLSRSQQFAECFFILKSFSFSDADLYTIISAPLQNSVTTMADTCLAELVSQGYFDAIITTNIDNGLEKALYEIGMKEHHDFEIVLPSSNYQPSSYQQFWEEQRLPLRITKVFGDFSLRNYSMQKHTSSFLKKPELEKFLQRTLARDTLVIGIDPTWDEALLQVLPKSAGTLYFVNEEDLTAFEPISSFLQDRQAQYILASYDKFIKGLYFNLSEVTLPLNYQLVRDMLDELHTVKKQLANLQNEIKDLQNEKSNLSAQSE